MQWKLKRYAEEILAAGSNSRQSVGKVNFAMSLSYVSTWVQLLRNAFCVMKSLLPPSGFLQLPLFTDSSFYPLTITTPLELLIAPTQFAAVFFNLASGFKNIREGIRNANRTTVWLNAINRIFISEPFKSSSSEFLIIKQGLESDRSLSRNRTFIGFLELIFGVAFIFLTLNTLHIVGPTHPKPLIDALISMEIGLAYILVIMWNSFTKKVRDFSKLRRLISTVKSLKARTAGALLLGAMDSGFAEDGLFDAFMFLDASYSPLWRTKNSSDVMSLAVEIQTEFRNVTAVFTKLKNVRAPSVETSEDCSLLTSLKKQEFETLLQAPQDLIYFALNFIAGYGYLLGILAFYIPEVKNNGLGMVKFFTASIDSTGESYSWCKLLMFGLTHVEADWWGNFAGDVAWTIEPLLILYFESFLNFFINFFSKKSLIVIKGKKKPKIE